MPDPKSIPFILDGIDIEKFHRLAANSPFFSPANLIHIAVRILLEEPEVDPLPAVIRHWCTYLHLDRPRKSSQKRRSVRHACYWLDHFG